MIKIEDIMTKSTETAEPATPIREVAQMMLRRDIGFVPVCEGDRLIGTITDRDLAIRAVAAGMPATAAAREVMTPGVEWCYADDDVEQAARVMSDRKVRRLVVLAREGNRLVGVLSLGDISTRTQREETTARTLEAVSEPLAARA